MFLTMSTPAVTEPGVGQMPAQASEASTGQGGRYVDTTKPYRISHGQIMDGDYLRESVHHFSQEGRTASFTACNNFDAMKWMGLSSKDFLI